MKAICSGNNAIIDYFLNELRKNDYTIKERVRTSHKYLYVNGYIKEAFITTYSANDKNWVLFKKYNLDLHESRVKFRKDFLTKKQQTMTEFKFVAKGTRHITVAIAQELQDLGLSISSNDLYNKWRKESTGVMFSNDHLLIFANGDIDGSNTYEGYTKYSLPKDYDIIIEEAKKYLTKKLTFGGKNVKIAPVIGMLHGEGVLNVLIECEGEKDNYHNIKKLKEAIDIIDNFKFGSKSLKHAPTSPQKAITFGCTTGTYGEIIDILNECEKLMK